MANEKSSQQERKILRRPMIGCQITKYGAGLLRMTVFNIGSASLLDTYG